mmetsp:Transcript_3248/g.3636  ORF Transcript_3248/g.3636 Transcript_3248/m.3636 type:complete len:161 (+) Transcript_3248:501-983(+)
MHVFGYLIGMSFYVAAPWTIIVDSPIWNHKTKAELSLPVSDFKPITFVAYAVSFITFTYASVQQHRAHQILASLRKRKTDTSYKIPKGMWFSKLSCPHYFFEIVIYAQMTMVTDIKPNIMLMVAFVALNLSITATQTHSWYRQKFDSYPEHRRAIIPYIL